MLLRGGGGYAEEVIDVRACLENDDMGDLMLRTWYVLGALSHLYKAEQGDNLHCHSTAGGVPTSFEYGHRPVHGWKSTPIQQVPLSQLVSGQSAPIVRRDCPVYSAASAPQHATALSITVIL